MWVLKVRSLAISLFVLITVILLEPLLPAQASTSLPHTNAQIDFSDRYVILLSGVNSKSSGSAPLGGDFEFIEERLITILGIPNENIAYFSYSATAKDNYCMGWEDGCTADIDLSYLHIFPVYNTADTHRRITHQAETLRWLIGQVVKKDPAAQIDIIGFSQGGLIAAYLGSKLNSSSPLYSHIHGIIAIESPLGGLPVASTCFEGSDDDLCPALKLWWGEELLRALQLPGTIPGSLVDDFPLVAEKFQFTSIQSKFDYTVNDLTFPIAWPLHGPQDAPIGRGSQLWVKSKQKLYYEELGGKGLATKYQSWWDTRTWITTNHHAPLKERRTVDWIFAALRDTAAEYPDEPSSSPSSSWEEFIQQVSDWWKQVQENTKKSLDELNKWWQEQQKRIADAPEQFWENLERQVTEWLEREFTEWLKWTLTELMNQCFSAAFLPVGALATVWIARRKKARRP